jgi:hypothetical protein
MWCTAAAPLLLWRAKCMLNVGSEMELRDRETIKLVYHLLTFSATRTFTLGLGRAWWTTTTCYCRGGWVESLKAIKYINGNIAGPARRGAAGREGARAPS